MGMPVVVNVIDANATNEDVQEVFSYLHYVDKKFSTYKKDSEISKIRRGEVSKKDFSKDMQKIFNLSEKTKKDTNGYFDININGSIDPSGIVKGYAIYEAAKILKNKGFKNFYIEIAGDVQVYGKNKGKLWKIGIQNPFDVREIVKVINITDKGVATSGNYIRGNHIYNPKDKEPADEIASITVVGPNVYEADRFATAAFAMGKKGILFIEKQKGFDGYMIRKDKKAVYTSGFGQFLN